VKPSGNHFYALKTQVQLQRYFVHRYFDEVDSARMITQETRAFVTYLCEGGLLMNHIAELKSTRTCIKVKKVEVTPSAVHVQTASSISLARGQC
jgi:hypothetical protein